jgi:hypothetical protein
MVNNIHFQQPTIVEYVEKDTSMNTYTDSYNNIGIESINDYFMIGCEISSLFEEINKKENYTMLCDLLNKNDYENDNYITTNFLNSLYINYTYFENVIQLLIESNNNDLYNKFLISIIMTDIPLTEYFMIKILNKAFSCDDNNLIRRALSTLEIINDKQFSQNFKNILLDNKIFAERLKKIIE